MPNSKSNKEIASNIFQKYSIIRKDHDQSNEFIINDLDIVTDKQYVYIHLLTKCDIHHNFLFKLLNVFRNNPRYCFSQITRNPYMFVMLPDNVMSFDKAKDIADRFSLSINKDFIFKAWIYDFILFKNNKFYIDKTYIKSKFRQYFDSNDISKYFTKENTKDKYVDDICIEVSFGNKKLYTMKELYDMELIMGDELLNTFYNKSVVINNDTERFIDNYENKKNIKFTKKQRKALKTCFGNKLSVVCGLPGTGKSTIADCICSYYENEIICLTAPTGMAINNLRNKCNVKKIVIGTIHKLLFDGFVEIKGDMPKIMIVDEFSMVDNVLFHKLIKWCAVFDCKLILLADDQQLPPIGGGYPLGAIIASKLFPVTYLKTIKRQEEGNLRSVILKLSNNDTIKNEDFDKKSIFFFDFKMENIDKLIKKFKLHPENSCFISPQHKHTEGTVNINNHLQSIYSTKSTPFYSKQFSRAEYVIKENDLVVRTINNYTENNLYANGDVARIRKSPTNNSIEVSYIHSNTSQEITIDELYEEFCLAYCLTVHKVQGSQYENVVLIMGDNHSFSWTNNDAKKLLYTAISRAIKRCFIIGNPQLFSYAHTLKCVNKHTLFLKHFKTYELS